MEAADNTTDVKVKVEKAGMNLWQQIAAYGVGTVALVYMLPRMMASGDEDRKFIQDKLITTLEKTTDTTSAQTTATNDLIRQVDKLVDKQDDLNDILKPLSTKLGQVATAVKEQVEQRDQETEAAK